MSDRPIIFDDDNPEWTAEDFARARPVGDFPELAAAFARPVEAGQPVSVGLDPDLVAHFRSGGAGWQKRINAALRKAVGLA